MVHHLALTNKMEVDHIFKKNIAYLCEKFTGEPLTRGPVIDSYHLHKIFRCFGQAIVIPQLRTSSKGAVAGHTWKSRAIYH